MNANVQTGALLMALAIACAYGLLYLTGRLPSKTALPVVVSDIERLKGDVARLENANIDLQRDNAGLRETLKIISRQNVEHQNRLAQIEQELAVVRMERDSLARRNSALEALLESRYPLMGFRPDKLRTALTDLFSDGELAQLAADIGVDEGALEGKTKGEHALSLIQYCERRNLTGKLVDAVRAARPNANV